MPSVFFGALETHAGSGEAVVVSEMVQAFRKGGASRIKKFSEYLAIR